MTLGKLFTNLGTTAARPWSFGILIAYAVLWVVFERDTFDFHGFATLATWGMTLFIQRAEHRDTQAIQAKLDELLRANSNASDAIATIDEEEPEVIEKRRESDRD